MTDNMFIGVIMVMTINMVMIVIMVMSVTMVKTVNMVMNVSIVYLYTCPSTPCVGQQSARDDLVYT